MITCCTFSGNSSGIYCSRTGAGGVTVTNCILWNTVNAVMPTSGVNAPTVTYSVVRSGFTGDGNTTVDPGLASLAYNGGATQTMAIGVGSSAFRTGTPAGAPSTDQRGFTRAVHPCMGAYEYLIYRVTASVSGDSTIGDINPKNLDVAHNDSCDVTISPNTGYKVESLMVSSDAASYRNETSNIINSGGVLKYWLRNVTKPHDIRVTFEPKTFNISVSADSGQGTVSIAGTIKFGESKDFTVTPKPGYKTDSVTADNGRLLQNGDGSYNLSAVTDNTTVSATFNKNEYLVNLITGTGGGTVTRIGSNPIVYGESPEYAISANEGYLIAQVNIDGTDLPEAADKEKFNCKIVNVTDSSRTLTVNFKLKKYAVTSKAGDGGKIAPSGDVLVEHGTDRAFAITANDGYVIDTLRVDGADQADAAGKKSHTYTFISVKSPRTINVTFKTAPLPEPIKPITPDVIVTPGEDDKLPPTVVPVPGVSGSEQVKEIVDKGNLVNIGVDVVVDGSGNLIISGDPKDSGIFGIIVKLKSEEQQDVRVEIKAFKKAVTTLLDLSPDQIKKNWKTILTGFKSEPDFELIFPVYVPGADADKKHMPTVTVSGADGVRSEVTTGPWYREDIRWVRVTGKARALISNIIVVNVEYRIGALEYSQTANVKLTDTNLIDLSTEVHSCASSSGGGCNAGFGIVLLLGAALVLKSRRSL